MKQDILRLAALAALFCTPALAQNTLRVPADQPTIQAAMNAANNGDTVLVSPGTYYETLSLAGKEITLTSTSGPGQTTIDGSSKGSVLTIRNTPTLRTIVSGFTFQHGDDGASGLGAGVSLINAGATVNGNVFHFNNLAASLSNSAATFTGNTIAEITGSTLCPAFGGVNISGGVIPAVLDANGASASVTIDGNTFSGPGTALCSGSGIYAVPGPTIFIQNNTFTGFTVGVDVTPGQSAFSKPIVVRQNIFRGNATGGVILGHATGAVFNQPPADTFVLNNSFSDNLLYAVPGLNQAEISTYGPGSTLVIANNAISTHSAVGTALYCGFDPPSDAEPATLPVLGNNVLFNPTGSVTSGAAGCTVQVGSDPGFISASDLHLASSSAAAVDGGNNGAPYLLALDFDGKPRVQLGKPTVFTFSRVDVGAYEYAGTIGPIYSSSVVPNAYFFHVGDSISLTGTLTGDGQPLSSPDTRAFFNVGGPISTLQTVTNGTATLAGVPLLFAGTSYLYAVGQTGGSSYASLPVPVWVSQGASHSVRLTSSLNPSTLGQSVTFTAQVSSAAGVDAGAVRFLDGSVLLATVTLDANGTGSFTSATLAPGAHVITASFTVAGSTTPTTGTLTQNVSGSPAPTTTTCFLSGPIPGGSFLLGATVTSIYGTPTGLVKFSSPPLTLSGSLFQGKSSVVLGPPASASNGYTATYLGDGSFSPSACDQNGPVSSVTLTSSPNPSTVGQTVSFNAHVSLPPNVSGGSFSYLEGSTLLSTVSVDANGNGVYTSSALAVGAHTLTAVYTPPVGSSATASYASVTQVVNGMATTTRITASPTTAVLGSTFLFTAQVTAASTGSQVPLGSVTFSVGSMALGTVTLVNGMGSFSTSNLPIGSDAVSATYSGDSLYSGGTSAPVTVTVQAPPTTLTFTSSVNPAPALSPVLLTARLLSKGSGVPAGNLVLFTISGQANGTLISGSAVTDSSGIAVFTTRFAIAGQYTVGATFSGTSSLAASTAAPLLEIIDLVPTTINLTASPNPAAQTNPVLLAATVSPALGSVIPLGLVTFFDGATMLGSSRFPALGSPATLNISSLSAGTHTLTATYKPEPNSDLVFLPSTSAPFTETILYQDFSVTVSPPDVSIQAAHHKDLTLTFTSVGGFTGTISLGCDNPLPPVLTCYMPTTVFLPVNSTATVTLTLETDAVRGYLASNTRMLDSPCTRPNNVPFFPPWVLFTAFALPAGLLSKHTLRLQKHPGRALLSFSLLLVLGSLTACSGRIPDHTPPGNYSVSITAQGTSVGAPSVITHTLPLALAVTP